MRILFYRWNAYHEEDVINALENLGNTVSVNATKCTNYIIDATLIQSVLMDIAQNKCELIFSINYYPVLSSVADALGILYYSWIFDAPHGTLYSLQAKMNCNRFFVFDSQYVLELKKMGLNNIYYMSMASLSNLYENAQYFWKKKKDRNRNKTQIDKRKFQCEVSLVGSMYDDEYNFFRSIVPKESEHAIYEEIVGLMNQKMFCYEEGILHKGVTSQMIDFLYENVPFAESSFLNCPREHQMLYKVFSKQISVNERRSAAEMLCERYDFKLFTYTPTDWNPKINNCGPVNYLTQMPIVFHESKINLNITIRSIQNGIPQRVFDIMGCEGFVLSNYQKDLAEEFVEGKEIVMFRSKEDLIDKIDYYLSHDEERLAIAQAGHKALCERFSYEEKLKQIFSTESSGE